MAGITVAAVALPLALAFGVSSGAVASAGLITAIIAGLVIGGLSGGFYQISGPTGAMAAILMSIAATKGMQGVLLATFLAGLFLLAAGLFPIRNTNFFYPSTSNHRIYFRYCYYYCIEVRSIICLVFIRKVQNVIEKLSSYQTLGFPINIASLIMGGLVILGMFIYPKKWAKRMPSSLLAII